MQFIHDNIAPDPAEFCSGVCKKVLPKLQEQFDDVVTVIIYVYGQVAEKFVGAETQDWNLKAHIFLWLLFRVEMLVMGPKQEQNR